MLLLRCGGFSYFPLLHHRCALSFLQLLCQNVPGGPRMVESAGGLEAIDDVHYSGRVRAYLKVHETPKRYSVGRSRIYRAVAAVPKLEKDSSMHRLRIFCLSLERAGYVDVESFL